LLGVQAHREPLGEPGPAACLRGHAGGGRSAQVLRQFRSYPDDVRQIVNSGLVADQFEGYSAAPSRPAGVRDRRGRSEEGRVLSVSGVMDHRVL